MRVLLATAIAVAAWHVPASATTPISSDVSGYAEFGISPGQKYFLAPADSKLSGTLEFNSYSRHVEKALRARQLVRVSERETADLVIFLSYGIGAPKKQTESYSIPTFGQTGVNSANTYGSVSSNGNISATTTYTPTFGITGSTTSVNTYDIYDRWVRLSAFQFQANEPKELWRTEVKSTGSTGDLRSVFPLMVFSSLRYIGTDTGKAIRVKMKETNKEFKAFIER